MKLLSTLIILIACKLSFAQQKYWRANVTTGEYGSLINNFIITSQGDYTYATTKPNAQKRIIGGLKGSFAKGIFQKDGSLIELDSISILNDKVTGYLLLQKKKYFLEGVKKQDSIIAIIKGKTSGIVYGKFEAVETSILEKPKDYAKVWSEMKGLTEQYIYKKEVLETKEWKSFVSYMDDFSKIAEDDAEFCFGFFYKSKDVPFTHYQVGGNKELASEYAIAGMKTGEIKPTPHLSTINTETLLLDVPAFNFRVADIDSIMMQIVQSTAKNLIIDLRQNPGGDLEGAMRICQYITDKPLYGGIMLSQVYWNTHTSPPEIGDYKNFKLMNTANYEWYKNEVKNQVEGLCIMTNPLATTFKGKIYILTSKITGSTSEPFVYSLQKENVAKIIGEQTAGAVVSMEYFFIQNLTLTIPTLDYYTFDGKRLDKVGVTPNIVCPSNDALNMALQEIAKQ